MPFHVKVGDNAQFTKTVGEYDIYSFAGITGDLSTNHVNEPAMRKTPYGGRIAHGSLLIGYMSTTSTMICDAAAQGAGDELPVSLGYDRIRFLKAVCIGDTITVRYTIVEVDEARRRSRSEIEVVNQDGERVAVAQHILKWIKV